jgi:uncharacterized protein
MALVIDGYNLLHASGILPSGVGPGTLERARAALLNFLVESLEAGELAKAVVVFDARAAPKGRPRLVTHRGLRVHFAPNPGDADALIEELIQRDHSPRQLIVVSSDHRLQRAAKRRRAQSIDSDRWYAEVVQRRVGRQRQSDDEPPKPTAALSAGEVAHWLSRFGMSPVEGEDADSGDAELADADAGEAEPPETDTGPAKPGSKKPRAKGKKSSKPRNLRNPFPPGYGEDLLEER